MQNINFWQNEGSKKTFTHNIEIDWIKKIKTSHKILDLGCGYGRISKQLYDIGLKDIIGYDYSEPLIKRAKRENPGPKYTSKKGNITKYIFDLVICFALFTSCPVDSEQTKLVKFINSRTKQNSILYISDYLISENPHYIERYNQKKLNTYGCFGSYKSVIFRHHKSKHFETLFFNWKKIKERKLPSKTLNGNDIIISQYLFQKI